MTTGSEAPHPRRAKAKRRTCQPFTNMEAVLDEMQQFAQMNPRSLAWDRSDKKYCKTTQNNAPHVDSLALHSEPLGVLLAHVHSVFMEVASKAFLYFHVLCVGSGTAGGTLRGESIQAMCERKQAQKLAFMRQIDVVGSDVAIVEYLADVVQSQHEAEFAAAQAHGNMDGFTAVAGIKLDHTVCTRFANTKGPFSSSPKAKAKAKAAAAAKDGKK